MSEEETADAVARISAVLFPDSPEGAALVAGSGDRPGVIQRLDQVIATLPTFVALPVETRLAFLEAVTARDASNKRLYEPKYVYVHAALVADGCGIAEGLSLVPKAEDGDAFADEVRQARNLPAGALRSICAPRRNPVASRVLALRMMDGLGADDLDEVTAITKQLGKGLAAGYLKQFPTLRGARLRDAVLQQTRLAAPEPTELIAPGTVSKAHGALFRLAGDSNVREPHRAMLLAIPAKRFPADIADDPIVRRMNAGELLVFLALVRDNPKLPVPTAVGMVDGLSMVVADGVARSLAGGATTTMRREVIAALQGRSGMGISQVRAVLLLADHVSKTKLPALMDRCESIANDDVWSRAVRQMTEFPAVRPLLAKGLTTASARDEIRAHPQLDAFIRAQGLAMNPPTPRAMTLMD